MSPLARSIIAALVFATGLICVSTAFAANNSAPANGFIQGRLVAVPNAVRLVRTPPRGVPRARIFLTEAATGKLLQQTLTASDGSFRFSVPPGNYLLMSPTAKMPAQVASGQTTPVVLQQIAR